MRGADQEGVAVGRLLEGIGRAERAAGAGLVLDQHALAELAVELGGERAGEGVGAAAGREGHDEHDRLLRPGLGMEIRGLDDKAGQQGQWHERRFCFHHGVPPEFLELAVPGAFSLSMRLHLNRPPAKEKTAAPRGRAQMTHACSGMQRLMLRSAIQPQAAPMILLSNGGTNIQRAQRPPTPSWSARWTASRCWRIRARLDRQAPRPAGRVRQRRHGARRRHAVRLDARRRRGAKRRRRPQMDLGQRRAWRITNSGRAAPASCRAATWCSPARCRRISTSARTRASPGAS